MSDPHRVSDEAVLTSIVETLRTQIVPALGDAWIRASAIQLAALAQMLRDRPSDAGQERAEELATLLGELGHPTDAWSYDAVLAACSSALAGWDEGDERRHRLRAVLIRHLDDDLTVNFPLLAAFRGSCPMRDELSAFFTGIYGRDVAVDTLSRISVGHSRAMYRVRLTDGTRLIVRREQGGVFGSSSAEEYRIMAALFAVGYPVAEVIAYEPTGAVLGQPFFVMKELVVPGGGAPDERAVDEPAARDFVRTIAQLHALDPATLPFAQVPSDPTDGTRLQIDRWLNVYRSATAVPIPLLDDAAAWLHRHVPVLDRLATVHGDAGPANFIHGDGKVIAITDFEFTHPGDPNEDWVFCIAMRGVTTMSRERWLEIFREEAGVTLDADTIRYWEAFNLFKGACANRTTLSIFESGANRNPNMGIIGTTLHQYFLRRLVDLVA